MRHASVGWTKSGQRTTLGLGVGWEEDLYEVDSSLNRKRASVEGTLGRQLTRALHLQLVATWLSNDYGEIGYDDDEWRAGLGLTWNLGRHFYLEFDADHYDRSSSNPTSEYDENRYFVRLGWRNTAEQ